MTAAPLEAGEDPSPVPTGSGRATGDVASWAAACVERLRRRAYGLVACTLSTGAMAAIAWLTDAPFIFPSLGPSIILAFCAPRSREASARNMVGGHLIGAAAGLLALTTLGLADEPSAIGADVTFPRVVAAALSVGLTALGMVVTDYVHAPAGSTTLLISLGVFRALEQVGVLAAAVLIVAAVVVLSDLFLRHSSP